MVGVTVTINGKPATAANIQSELERAAIEAMKESITEMLRPLSSSSGESLKVDLVGSDLNNLEIKLSGPQELIDKAKVLLDVK
jgi:hypothetical protein